MTLHAERSRTYIAIDLKSFYASVECVDRGLDPLTTHLVVADASRTNKTICLAVSPSLKAYGIGGRARLFEAQQYLRKVNAQRQAFAPHQRLHGKATDSEVLRNNPALAADMIVAKPHMHHYLEVSAQIYRIYLQYAAPEDIHVYSVDEVFIDATRYLRSSGCSAQEFATRIVLDILRTTGITATAGIGDNLYVCKVAMDIVAKHMPSNRDGVRVATLNEYSYRKLLWAHTPLTDFWRIGRGTAKRLASLGLMTMGDIARCSLGKASDFYNAQLLYSTFGINAQLLIDHAWGYEPCTIADIKEYQPQNTSLSSGQVLQEPYDFAHAQVVVKEMVDALTLDMVAKGYTTSHIGLYIGYERMDAQTTNQEGAHPLAYDYYGRVVPKPARGTITLARPTDSSTVLREHMMKLYRNIVDATCMIRRVMISFHQLEPSVHQANDYEQLDIFALLASGELESRHDEESQRFRKKRQPAYADATSVNAWDTRDARAARDSHDSRDTRDMRDIDQQERAVSQAVLAIQQKFGRSAVIKAMSLEQGATGLQRNQQIGGHAA